MPHETLATVRDVVGTPDISDVTTDSAQSRQGRAGKADAVSLESGYQPLPAQQAFHDSPATVRLFSGGFGCGKTKAGCRESIIHAVQFPGSQNLVARLKYRPLWRTTMKTFFRELREMGLHKPAYSVFRKNDMELGWWNGSTTIFTNLDDIENFKSLEVDTVFIDEGAEVPDSVYDILIPGRLRGVCNVSINGEAAGRAWIATNPGASGWIRRHFVDVEGGEWDYDWFHAPTSENVFNPPGYNEQLRKRYSGVWFKRYHDGDWMAFEGQVFPQFDPNTHVLPANWEPHPKQHNIIEGFDFGFVNPTAVVWIAQDKRGEFPPVVFADYEEEGLSVEEHSHNIKQVRKRFGLDRGYSIESYGDPAARSSFQNTGSSFFIEYYSCGIDLMPSEKSPQVRAIRLARHLERSMRTSSGELPCILFSPRTERTINSIRQLRWTENTSNTGEDPQEKFHKSNDHLFDALSYGLIAHEDPEDMTFTKPLPKGIGMPAQLFDKEEEVEGTEKDFAYAFWNGSSQLDSYDVYGD